MARQIATVQNCGFRWKIDGLPISIDLWRRKEVRVSFSRPFIEIVPIAAMDAAMAPPFVVVLPAKLAAGQSAVGVERPVKVRKGRRRPDDID